MYVSVYGFVHMSAVSMCHTQKLGHSPEANSFTETCLLENLWCPITRFVPAIVLRVLHAFLQYFTG